MTFAAQVEKWVVETEISGGVVMRKLGLDALGGVQFRSPVDEGRFRGSHRIALNRPDLSVEPELAPGSRSGPSYGAAPTGAEIQRGLSVVGEARWSDEIIVSNNLVYGPPLEDGSSAQNGNAVDGIYGATFAELSANLAKSVLAARAEAKRGGL